MSKKRQSNSSIVSIMDEDNLDLHEIDEDGALSSGSCRRRRCPRCAGGPAQ